MNGSYWRIGGTRSGASELRTYVIEVVEFSCMDFGGLQDTDV